MAEQEDFKVSELQWFDSRRKLKGAIRKAKVIQVYVHPDYFGREFDDETPRHKVTGQYALEFADQSEESALPGLATLSEDPLTYLLIPHAWKGEIEDVFGLTE